MHTVVQYVCYFCVYVVQNSPFLSSLLVVGCSWRNPGEGFVGWLVGCCCCGCCYCCHSKGRAVLLYWVLYASRMSTVPYAPFLPYQILSTTNDLPLLLKKKSSCLSVCLSVVFSFWCVEARVMKTHDLCTVMKKFCFALLLPCCRVAVFGLSSQSPKTCVVRCFGFLF